MKKADFKVQSFKGGFDDNFTYLVTCGKTNTQFLIDASVPFREISSNVSHEISSVFITHTHGDHIAYLNEVISSFPDLKVIIFRDSVSGISGENIRGVDDHSQIQAGNLNIEVIHTPGHYDDSLCFHMGNILFTGDTLFVGRTGRTISLRSDTRQLYRSVYKKLLILPGDTLLYPGHDYGPKPYCTLKENIEISPLLCAVDEDDFVFRMEEYERKRLS